ncbi:MAG: phosphatidylserine synthase [Bacteroidales bacterium]|nr:phosphatidylserine synthase [Bacteroidales bacterium]
MSINIKVMRLEQYSLIQLAEIMAKEAKGCIKLSGKQLVELFNKHGKFKDVYDFDNGGLPKLTKGQPLNTTKTNYAKDRLEKINSTSNLINLIEDIINNYSINKEQSVKSINDVINDDGYNLQDIDGMYKILGNVVVAHPIIRNDAHFQDIQNKIINALDQANLTIDIAVAWFTNEVICDKLKEKKEENVNIRIIVNNDGTNKNKGIDFSLFDTIFIRSSKGGLMHDKFCVIDNHIVINGSYNWTDSAEFKNEENINVTYNDINLSNEYSLKFKELWQQGLKKRSFRT